MPWRNRLGVTRDLVTCRDDAGALLYQIGIAELTDDAAFSDLSGMDRLFTPIGAAGVCLWFDGETRLDCPALVPVAFAGERQVRMTLPHGPARAFNLMAARPRFRGAASAISLPAGTGYEHRFADAGAILCVSGRVGLPRSRQIGPDQLLFAAPGDLVRLHAAVGSQIVIATISNRS